MASSARAACEAAYSKLCSSLDSVARLVAVPPPQTHTSSSPLPGQRSSSARSLPPVQRPDLASPSTHSRPLLPGSLPSGMQRSGVGAVAGQHGGGHAAAGPLRSALERLSMGSRDAGSATSSPSRQRPADDRSATAARPGHRRTLSDDTGIHSVSGIWNICTISGPSLTLENSSVGIDPLPLRQTIAGQIAAAMLSNVYYTFDELDALCGTGGVKPKLAAGVAKAKERRDVLEQTEADPVEVFNELEQRRLALYR